MARFSERNGHVATLSIQFERVDEALRNSLWNVIALTFFTSNKFCLSDDAGITKWAKTIYDKFLKKPVMFLKTRIHDFVKEEFAWFSTAKWYEIYDYCEFVFNYSESGNIRETFWKSINDILEIEKSAYRFIGNYITPIIEGEQIEEIQAVVDAPYEYRAAAEHIRSALRLYAERITPDYRNSIKESISAVESAAKIVSGKENATLSDAIKVIDGRAPMHEAFKLALLKLYGYTSDEKGIRHALLDETNINEADARFMIVACSAFVSYIIARAKQ